MLLQEITKYSDLFLAEQVIWFNTLNYQFPTIGFQLTTSFHSSPFKFYIN